MEQKQRLSSAILRVASTNPEFRKALVAELKTARTEFSDVARQVARELGSRIVPVPFNRVLELKNYRDPRLTLDPDAPEVAYLIKNIEYGEGTTMFDISGSPGNLEVIIDAILAPCVVKSNGRKAMLVLTYDGQSNPLSSQAYDEDYDIEPFKVSEVVNMIEGAASSVGWADEEANIRAASAPVSVLTPPKFDANQYRYFKGPGKTLMRVWRQRKENPKWNLINRVVEHFEGYKYLREKPGWEDQEQTVSIMDAMDKLIKYRDHLYPGGKPKPPKKKSPRAVFLEQMEYPEVKALISKFSRIFKGKPAEAGQFAYDVLEDANFHRDGRNMNVAMADYSGTTRVAPSSVAQRLEYSSTVLPFAVGIVAGAGDKRGAMQMLKTFVQMNKDWYVEQN